MGSQNRVETLTLIEATEHILRQPSFGTLCDDAFRVVAFDRYDGE